MLLLLVWRMRDLLYVYRMFTRYFQPRFVVAVGNLVCFTSQIHQFLPLFFFDFAEFSGLLYFSHLLIWWCVERKHMRIYIFCSGFRPQQPSKWIECEEKKIRNGKVNTSNPWTIFFELGIGKRFDFLGICQCCVTFVFKRKHPNCTLIDYLNGAMLDQITGHR